MNWLDSVLDVFRTLWVKLTRTPHTFEIDFRTADRFEDVQRLVTVWDEYPYFMDQGLLKITLRQGNQITHGAQEAYRVVKHLRAHRDLFPRVDSTKYYMPDGSVIHNAANVPAGRPVKRVKLSGEVPSDLVP